MRTRIPVVKKKASLREIGTTGLEVYAGQITEEFLRQLSGRKGVTVYQQMADNDPVIGGILFIIDKLLRNVKWKVRAANETPAAKEVAEFVESCMGDMEHSWEDLISEVLSMLTFGWSAHEIVYKVRMGIDQTDPSYYSKYKDGNVGWRKLPIRAQETLDSWVFNESGDVVALKQRVYSTDILNGDFTIPVTRLLLFKTTSRKGNPMGRSVLRNAYRPWFFKKRIEEIEGIGIERDLAGLPVAHVPANILAESASVEEKATLSAIKQLVTNIRRDHQEGVIFPLVYDENGNKLYELELLSTGGTRQFDTSTIIDRYDKRIAMTVLADFIFLGQSRVGSYALSSDKTSMFSLALGAWLQGMACVLNKSAIPPLMKVNAIPAELWPEFKPGDIEKTDIKDFTEAIYKLVGVGAIVPSEELNQRLYELLEVPIGADDGTNRWVNWIQPKPEEKGKGGTPKKGEK